VKASHWHSATIVWAVLFCAFSTVHLIDDFFSGVPFEFHLSVPIALLLSFTYTLALTGLVAAASNRSPTAYLGLAIAGSLIFLAQLLKSVPEMAAPGAWHLGRPSEIAAIGLGVSGAMTALCSFVAWRSSRSAARGASAREE
jgi:hypothetical protein